MFEALIVKPIFNLLVFIQAILPGHNFGLAIIVFTLVVRFLMWPLIKKQMRQTKAMRELQPELKRIKKETKGNRQLESMMLMELYKERGINPFSSIGTLIVQLIVIIGLYSGLRRVVDNPQAVVDYSYSWLQNFGWIKEIAGDIGRFDDTLFGLVDLSRAAIGQNGTVYYPAMAIVIGSAVAQYYQSKQLMPTDKNARTLRQILREASGGKSSDAAETNAAVSRSMRYFIPALIFLFTVGLASALSLYWFVSGLVAYAQQAYLLNKDEEDLERLASDKTTVRIIEGEVVKKEFVKGGGKSTKKRSGSKSGKRRKK